MRHCWKNLTSPPTIRSVLVWLGMISFPLILRPMRARFIAAIQTLLLSWPLVQPHSLPKYTYKREILLLLLSFCRDSCFHFIFPNYLIPYNLKQMVLTLLPPQAHQHSTTWTPVINWKTLNIPLLIAIPTIIKHSPLTRTHSASQVRREGIGEKQSTISKMNFFWSFPRVCSFFNY